MKFIFLLHYLSLFLFTHNLLAQEQFVDARDGEVYNYTIIGDQVWMVDNLRFKAKESVFNPQNPNKYYGRLYNWKVAQKACPKGWRLPSKEDWNRLVILMKAYEYQGYIFNTNLLKSKTGWKNEYGNGTNTSGMNILPSGVYFKGNFSSLGMYTSFHCASSSEREIHHFTIYDNHLRAIDKNIVNNKDVFISCRCIKE